jgi:hypothetical protein
VVSGGMAGRVETRGAVMEKDIVERLREAVTTLVETDQVDDIGVLEAARIEIQRLRYERAWQPIEMAPRTADYILVWDPAYMTTRVVSWYDAPRVGPKIHPNDGYWGISMSDQECEPTHWQPLPAPPASESNRPAEPTGAENGSGW